MIETWPGFTTKDNNHSQKKLLTNCKVYMCILFYRKENTKMHGSLELGIFAEGTKPAVIYNSR